MCYYNVSRLNFHIITELDIVYFTIHKKTNSIPTYIGGFTHIIGIYKKL